MRSYAIFFLLIIACLSCETDITDSFRDTGDRLIVLNGQLSPDSIPRIYLSRTLSMVETGGVIPLTDADLTLYANGQSYSMTGGEGGVYTCEDYLPQAGDEVRISCSEEGLPDAGAEISINSFWKKPELQASIDDEYYLNLDITLADPPEAGDYYSIYLAGWRKELNHTYEKTDSGYIEYTDTVYEYTTYYMHYPTSLGEIGYSNYGAYNTLDEDWEWGNDVFFSDRLFNGQELQLRFSVNMLYTFNDTVPEVDVHFFKRDEPYYRFIESMTRYNPNPDLPIVQPVQIYSNIEGGMGLLFSAEEARWTVDMSSYYSDPGFLQYMEENFATYY